MVPSAAASPFCTYHSTRTTTRPTCTLGPQDRRPRPRQLVFRIGGRNRQVLDYARVITLHKISRSQSKMSRKSVGNMACAASPFVKPPLPATSALEGSVPRLRRLGWLATGLCRGPMWRSVTPRSKMACNLRRVGQVPPPRYTAYGLIMDARTCPLLRPAPSTASTTFFFWGGGATCLTYQVTARTGCVGWYSFHVCVCSFSAPSSGQTCL